jgi:hypothetical protein
VRFGRTVPRGFLPAYSVDSDEEAKALLILACLRNLAGEFVAPELAEEQTLARLYSFGDRLRELHSKMKAREK